MNIKQQIENVLDSLFKEFGTVTTALVQKKLEEQNEQITTNQISLYFEKEDYDYKLVNRERVYLPKVKQLTPEVIQSLVTKPMSLETIKRELKSQGYNMDEFTTVFTNSGVIHTGKYTKDNKKLYIFEKSHYSKTRQREVEIASMHPKYLKNSISRRGMDGGHTDVRELLNQKDTQMYKLVEAYFTYDLRTKLNQLKELLK